RRDHVSPRLPQGFDHNKPRESIDVQRDLIARYCQDRSLGEPLWYIDSTTSGKLLLRNRDAGAVLCKSLQPVDHVVITKLDRAFRKLSDCVVIVNQFNRLKVHLHVCNLLGDAIDLSQWMGRSMIQFLAVFADLERAFIAERTGEASRARRARGEGIG